MNKTTKLIIGSIIIIFIGAKAFYFNNQTGNIGATTLKVPNGGTGTTTAPSLGQMLIGNASGGYDYIASSSLGGISGGMIYPGAGIALSTGSGWDTSITNNSANWNTAYGWGDWHTPIFLTQAIASSSYQPLGTYATQAYGSSTYALLSSIYLTQAFASTTYQPIGTYVTQAYATSTYQPLLAFGIYDPYGQATSTLGSHTTSYNHNLLVSQAYATSSFVSRADWTTNDNYPSACSAGQYVSAIGDTLTCGTPAGGGGSGVGWATSSATQLYSVYDRVGIGTTAPVYMLEVAGTVSLGTGTAVLTTQDSGATTTNLTVSGSFWAGTLNGLGLFTNGLLSVLSTAWSKISNVTGLTTFHKGSLMTATTTDVGLVELTVGSDGQQLTASSTTSTGLAWESSTKGMYSYPKISYATSTWSGTTTREFGGTIAAETYYGASCKTVPSGSTVDMVIGNGTASSSLIVASSTNNYIAFTAPLTFSAGNTFYFSVGTPASSPVEIGCQFKKQLSSDL